MSESKQKLIQTLVSSVITALLLFVQSWFTSCRSLDFDVKGRVDVTSDTAVVLDGMTYNCSAEALYAINY